MENILPVFASFGAFALVFVLIMFILPGVFRRVIEKRNETLRANLSAIGMKLLPDKQDGRVVGYYNDRPVQILTAARDSDASLEIHLKVKHPPEVRLWISHAGMLPEMVAAVAGYKSSRSWTGDSAFDNRKFIASTPKTLIGDILSGDGARSLRARLMQMPRVAIDMEQGLLRCHPNKQNDTLSRDEWLLWLDVLCDLADRVEAAV